MIISYSSFEKPKSGFLYFCSQKGNRRAKIFLSRLLARLMDICVSAEAGESATVMFRLLNRVFVFSRHHLLKYFLNEMPPERLTETNRLGMNLLMLLCTVSTAPEPGSNMVIIYGERDNKTDTLF